MKVIMSGTLSDVLHRSFTGDDKSVVEYNKVEIFDPTAFSDSNRHFIVSIMSKLVKDMDLLNPKVLNAIKGKDFEFQCEGSPDKYGALKLRITGMKLLTKE